MSKSPKKTLATTFDNHFLLILGHLSCLNAAVHLSTLYPDMHTYGQWLGWPFFHLAVCLMWLGAAISVLIWSCGGSSVSKLYAASGRLLCGMDLRIQPRASGVAVGVHLGSCVDNSLGNSRLHKAGAVAILFEVVLRRGKERFRSCALYHSSVSSGYWSRENNPSNLTEYQHAQSHQIHLPRHCGQGRIDLASGTGRGH